MSIINMKKEHKRILTYYESRKQNPENLKYSYFDVGNLYIIQSRERKFLKILNSFNFKDLSKTTILDVGCGSGNILCDLLRYGAKPRNLFGVDLLAERIKKAKEILAASHFEVGDATDIPFQGNYFDIVMQNTVFTSILDREVKTKIAKEMLRVLRSEGCIVWYDMFITNPFDENIKAIRKKEIKALFPGCIVDFHSVILNPFISRRLAKISTLACIFLEKFKVLNSHYFAIIRKK